MPQATGLNVEAVRLHPKDDGLFGGVIVGVDFQAGNVNRLDLRASASLVLAALVADGDTVIERNGHRVLIDPESLPFLSGSVIDFKDELIGARFAVDNPNATSTCGCGTSFSV